MPNSQSLTKQIHSPKPKNCKFKKIVAFILLCSLCFSLFAQEKPQINSSANANEKIEPILGPKFDTFLKDARRFEIISLGSLPFTTLTVNLGYSLYKYFQSGFSTPIANPLSQNGSSLTSNEQLAIFLTSASISVVIGIVDYIVNKTQSKKVEDKINKENQELFDTIIIEGE